MGLLQETVPIISTAMAFRTASFSLRRMMSTSTPRSITINDDHSVQIIAEEAHKVEDLDLAAAREVLASAQAEASKAGDEVAKAEAQIAVEVGEALVAAAQ